MLRGACSAVCADRLASPRVLEMGHEHLQWGRISRSLAESTASLRDQLHGKARLAIDGLGRSTYRCCQVLHAEKPAVLDLQGRGCGLSPD